MIDQKRLESLKTTATVRDLIEREFCGDTEAFVDAIDASLNRLLLSDLGHAKRFVTAAERLKAYLPAEWGARFLSQRSRLSLWSGDYSAARAGYEKALAQFLRYRNFEAAARLRKGLVEVLMYLGEPEAAISTGRKALRYFRRHELRTDEAQVLTNIGNVYHRADRNRLALDYYQKARKIFARKGGVPLAIVDFNRANIHSNLNELNKAKKLYLDSAAIYRKAGLHIASAQAHYSVAYLSFLESKYAEALEGFERVYDTFLELGDRKSAAITLLDLVELEVHLHLYASAVYLGGEVISSLRKLKLTYEEGKANYFVATAMIELSELRQAQKYLRRAESLFKRENNELWLGMVTLARAQLALKDTRTSDAIKLTRKARSHFTASGDKRRENDALLVQVEALAYAKGTPSGFDALVKKLRQSGLVKYQRYKLASTVGDFYLSRGRNSEAVRELRVALIVAEEMLDGLNQDEIRVLFAADITESYNRLAQAYLAEQKQRSALVEVLRGMAVLNLQGQSRRKMRLPGSIQTRIDSLRAQIARLQRVEQDGQRASTTAGYRNLEQRLWRLQRSARAAGGGKQSAVGVSGDQIETILDKLQGETLVHFHKYRDEIGAFIANADGVRHVALGVLYDEFQRTLRKTYFLLEQGLGRHSGSEASATALTHYRHLLYQQLIAPLTSHLGNDQIILAVDREFLQVPYSLLLSENDESLNDCFDLTVLVNPLDLKRGGHRWKARSISTIIGSDSGSLPLVRDECEAIHKIFDKARLLTGEVADTDAVREALDVSNGFVHIAAHAARVAENPLFSRILLANGPLFPFEISGRVKAQLVTLSGCQTAAPGLYHGNSFSLAKAFYQAGGRAVLASLWSVADDVTFEFMTEFYRHLAASGSIRNSYSQAVKKVRALTDNPAHWGAFVMLGAVK